MMTFRESATKPETIPCLGRGQNAEWQKTARWE